MPRFFRQVHFLDIVASGTVPKIKIDRLKKHELAVLAVQSLEDLHLILLLVGLLFGWGLMSHD